MIDSENYFRNYQKKTEKYLFFVPRMLIIVSTFNLNRPEGLTKMTAIFEIFGTDANGIGVLEPAAPETESLSPEDALKSFAQELLEGDDASVNFDPESNTFRVDS